MEDRDWSFDTVVERTIVGPSKACLRARIIAIFPLHNRPGLCDKKESHIRL